MDEFIVIKVMNEAMLRLKKSNKEDCSQNEKIKKMLEDRDVFSKIDKIDAMKLLPDIGVADDKLEETYKKLIK